MLYLIDNLPIQCMYDSKCERLQIQKRKLQYSPYFIEFTLISLKRKLKHSTKLSLTKYKMLKSFLQLNINQPHNKAEYSIKKNKLILLPNQPLYPSKTTKTEDHVVSRVTHTEKQSRFGSMSRSKHTVTRIVEDESTTSNSSSSISKTLPSEVKFDCITYDYKSTNQKLLYEFLMLKPSQRKHATTFNIELPPVDDPLFPSSSQLPTQPQPQKPVSMTITFNYDIEYEKLEELLIELMQIKKFQTSQFKLAHFQLRNNHISDYNKSLPFGNLKRTAKKSKPSTDEMDTFTKEIDTCIKLDKTWKIMENINFKKFTLKDYKEKDILNKNSRTNYDKKTNQFFVLDIDDGKYELVIIVLHRQRDYVLTKVQDKEIQEAFVLLKNAVEGYQNQKINLEFTTSIVQIIQAYLMSSDQVVFVSQYPTLNNCSSLAELLKIPIKIEENRPEEVQKIIQTYNKQKETKLETEMQKMKTKLRQITHKRKTTQENIAYLMKKYKKGFQNIFDSLAYLKNNNITDLGAFRANLENQIRQKDEEIRQTLENLKELNYEIITAGQRNEYFREKMEILKDNLQQNLQDIDCGITNQPKRTTKQISSTRSKPNNDSDIKSPRTPRSPKTTQKESTEAILKKFLEVQEQTENPYSVQLKRQKEKYSNELREKTRERLMKSREVEQFHNLMDELRKKVSKHQFTKLQQKYLGLISMI